jgi:hypothetical protein
LIAFSKRAIIPAHVIVQDVGGESVLLNQQSQRCFDLDEVGTAMWTALTTAASIQEAYEALLAQYDAAPELLREDMEQLIGLLVETGLLELADG